LKFEINAISYFFCCFWYLCFS